jgi:hypothetical protein
MLDPELDSDPETVDQGFVLSHPEISQFQDVNRKKN